jgi:hypothetical protein
MKVSGLNLLWIKLPVNIRSDMESGALRTLRILGYGVEPLPSLIATTDVEQLTLT